MRLDKDHRLLRIESGRQPVKRDFKRIFLDARCVGVVGGERVPVGHHEKALVLVLHAHPVLQCAHIVAKMQLAGRTHAAKHAFAGWGRRCRGLKSSCRAEFDTNTRKAHFARLTRLSHGWGPASRLPPRGSPAMSSDTRGPYFFSGARSNSSGAIDFTLIGFAGIPPTTW